MEKVSLCCCQRLERCEISSTEISALSRAVGLWGCGMGFINLFPVLIGIYRRLSIG